MMHKRLLIGSSLVLLALIFGLTLEQKFSKRAATVLAAETVTTTPTLAPTDSCNFGGVQIPALNHAGVFTDRFEVGWDYTLPQQLAPLGACATLDHFEVKVEVVLRNGSTKTKTENASPVARNAVVRFLDGKDIKSVHATVIAFYKITATSVGALGKDL